MTSAFGRSVRLELPIDPVQRAGRRVVRHGGANRLATPLALQAQTLHQTFDCAARHRNAFAVQLPPDLVGPIDLEVGLPDPLDLRQQDPIALGAGAAQFGRAPPVGRRGDLQDLADRLDPVRLPVLVDAGVYDFSLRSSSAWAKKALAVLRISLARRSSLFSRSSCLRRSRSEVVRPSR